MSKTGINMLFRRILRTSVLLMLAIPLTVLSYFYLMQDSLVFRPKGISAERLELIRINYPNAEEINIQTPDNINLHGWLLRNQAAARSPLLIYYGGNAVEVSSFLPDMDSHLEGWSVLMMNSRGYGLSGGRPGQKELFNDAVLIYDVFSKRADIDNLMIVAMGRSLGTGVAIHTASVRPFAGVLLVSPFDSITSVAREMYPFLPVSLMLRHPFDSLSLAPSIRTPALAFIASNDTLTTPQHSKVLMESWGGQHETLTVEGADHNSIMDRAELWEGVKGFLEDLSP
jgi:pimeloyl-ACP methyl ester carboxylesterase